MTLELSVNDAWPKCQWDSYKVTKADEPVVDETLSVQKQLLWLLGNLCSCALFLQEIVCISVYCSMIIAYLETHKFRPVIDIERISGLLCFSSYCFSFVFLFYFLSIPSYSSIFVQTHSWHWIQQIVSSHWPWLNEFWFQLCFFKHSFYKLYQVFGQHNICGVDKNFLKKAIKYFNVLHNVITTIQFSFCFFVSSASFHFFVVALSINIHNLNYYYFFCFV